MKQVHIVSHDTYASGLTPGTGTVASIASLANGAFALVNKDPESASYNKIVDLASATAVSALPSKVQFVTKSANNGLKWSSIITVSKGTAQLLAAVAAVAKVVFVGNQTDGGTTYSLNLPTLAAGDLAGVTVIDTSKPVGTLRRERSYTYELKSGDDAAAIITALAAIINADAHKIVTAANAHAGATLDGFKLTGSTAGVNFEVAPIGVFRSANITTAGAGTAVTTAQGNAAQIKDLEKFDMVERGLDDARRQSEVVIWTSDVNTAKSYDQLVVINQEPIRRPFDGGANELSTLTIAVQSDLTAASASNDKTKTAIATIASLM